MEESRFDDEWLKRRLDLFDKFTYPSVVAQTDQKFRWRGIVHEDSPSWFLKELEKYPRMEVHKVDVDIEVAVRGEDSVNLDTDDALARDFIYQARKIDHRGESLFLRGTRYRILTDCWTGVKMPGGHFNIVKDPKLTVLDFIHGRSGTLPVNVVDIKAPMWLEVIHEENIANRLRTAKKDQNLGYDYTSKYFELNMGEGYGQ